MDCGLAMKGLLLPTYRRSHDIWVAPSRTWPMWRTGTPGSKIAEPGSAGED